MNEEEEEDIKIDLSTEGPKPESIDGYAPQIILSPLNSTFHFQEVNHSTFTSSLSHFYDILDQSSSFRERWKKFRDFFYHYPNQSSHLLIDFYNSAKEWSIALEPFCGKKSVNLEIGNHLPFFRILLLPAFDEFFQTIALMYTNNIDNKDDFVNDQDFLDFTKQESAKSNVINKIMAGYNNIFRNITSYQNTNISPSNITRKPSKKKSKTKKSQQIQKNKNFGIETLHEILIEKRINIILLKFLRTEIANENFLYAVPIYHDICIKTGFENKTTKLNDFNLFVSNILNSLPPYQQIFSHLMSAIPIIKYIKEPPISFLNDTEPVFNKHRVRQSKLTFRYFLYSLLIVKNFHSILHIFQAYYSQNMSILYANPEILKTVNSIFYQQYKLTKFIMKYEENFQLLIRQNILIFLYYLRQLKSIGENPERRAKQDSDESDDEEKTYYKYHDDFDTLNPEYDIESQNENVYSKKKATKKESKTMKDANSSPKNKNENNREKKKDEGKGNKNDNKKDDEKETTTERDTKKDSKKETEKDSKKESKKDTEKDTEKESKKDTEIESKKESKKDKNKDADKDTKKDSKKDSKKDKKGTNKDADKDSKKETEKNTKKDKKETNKDADKDSKKETEKNTKKDKKETNKDADKDSNKETEKNTKKDTKKDKKETNKDADKDSNKDTKNDTKTDTKNYTKNNQKEAKPTANKSAKKDDKKGDVNTILLNMDSIEDDNLYLKKLKSLIPSVFSSEALANSSSMFSSMLIALCYKVKLANSIDEYFFQWPMVIDFRNTLEEFSDYSFLFINHNQDSESMSIVRQMIYYATKPLINIKPFHYPFADPENTNFLCLFSIYDSALIANPNLRDEIIKEAEEVLDEALDQVANCLIGYNDIDVKIGQYTEADEEEYDKYTDPKNNINNRFISFLKIQSFQMLGRLYQIGSILSKRLNKLFYEKIDKVLHKSLTRKDIKDAIHNLQADREKFILLNTRHEFLVANGAVLDPYNDIFNYIMCIRKPGQIESRVSVGWSKLIIEQIIKDFTFNIVNLDFTKIDNDKAVKFNTDKLFVLLKMTPFGGTAYYIKKILASLDTKERIAGLIHSINNFQNVLIELVPCPIYPYGSNFESQFQSYKNTLSCMDAEAEKSLIEVHNEMEWFGNHLCMLLILDLASEVDQSNHTTFASYILRSVDASKGKQACSYIFDSSWFEINQTKIEYDKIIPKDELSDFDYKQIDTKPHYFERLKMQYDQLKLENKFLSSEITKIDRKSVVDLNSALVEGIAHFQEAVQDQVETNMDKLKNMVNVMLFWIVLNESEEKFSGGFLMCAVALLKALNMWNSFQVDCVIQRLCYQLKIKLKGQTQKGQENQPESYNDYINPIHSLFYQLELCDYYV